MKWFDFIKDLFASRADRNQKRYLQNLQRNMPAGAAEIELEMVYTDKNGNNFYTYKHFHQMPQSRVLAVQHLALFASVGVTPEYLQGIVTDYKKYAEQKDGSALTSVHNKIYELDILMKESRPQELYIKIAAALLLIDHEDPHTYSQQITDKKIQLANQDEFLSLFFSQIGSEYMKVGNSESDKVMATYLAAVAQLQISGFGTSSNE